MRRILRVSMQMYIENLSVTLYSYGQALMELIRNGVVACQPDEKSWDPRLAKIEIMFTKRLQFTGGPAIGVIDHGCGMTEPRLDRYFGWLGTPEDEVHDYENGQNAGASQKGMGRLSPFKLNKLCRRSNKKAGDEGYYLFSRSEPTGNIRLIHVTPRLLSLEEGIEDENFVSPDSTEAAFLKGIKGTFTAIIIPNPVFQSEEDILDHIKYLLPREQDKMFDITINGKKIVPPPLWDDVNETGGGGKFRARIGSGNKAGDGIWLCDAATGLRVASCVKLGRLLPEVLGFPDLGGDIFAPNVLGHQNPARDSLSNEYTIDSNPEWQELKMFLAHQVAPKVNELVERDPLDGNVVDILNDLVNLFEETFGPPEREKVITPGPGPGPGPGPKPTPEPKTPTSKRGATVKIRDKVWRLHYNQPLGKFQFAIPSSMQQDQILVNVRGEYLSMPTPPQAALEHCLMQILEAIGEKEAFGMAHEARKFANEVRFDFLKKKKGGK